MFNFFKNDNKTYMNSVNIDLSYLCPDEKQWEDFVMHMQRKHKYIESKTIGTLDYHYKNE